MTFLVPYAHQGLALDISKLISNQASKLNLTDLASKIGINKEAAGKLGTSLQDAGLKVAAEAATNVPAVTVNRARIAAMVNLGYTAADTYQSMKPGLFIAGIIGTVVSSTALAKRRKNPEAVALYGIIAAISAATAWVTRPDMLKGTPPVPEESNPNAPGVVKSALNSMDARVTKLTASQPGWEGATLTRLLNDLGSGTMAPAVKTLLTRNAH